MITNNLKLKIIKIVKSLNIKNLKQIIITPFKWFKKTNRRNRSITLAGIILILAPIVINTLIDTTTNQVRADSFFKFDEGYGITSAVNDSNGAVSAGSITGATWKTDDLCFDGKCLYFDGDQDFVKFSDDDDLY